MDNYAPPTQGYGRFDVRENDRSTIDLEMKMDNLIEQVAVARGQKDTLFKH